MEDNNLKVGMAYRDSKGNKVTINQFDGLLVGLATPYGQRDLSKKDFLAGVAKGVYVFIK